MALAVAVKSLRVARIDNRLPAVLDAAAGVFAEFGYSSSSMRQIAKACGMQPGSLYYHYEAKDALLLAVYERGVEEIRTAILAAIDSESDPWQRLEAACVAHLETLLRESQYAKVLISVVPKDVPTIAEQLIAARNEHEKLFEDLVTDLPLPDGRTRTITRLMLLGALNWSRLWFNSTGQETPESLARKFVKLLKEAQG